MPKTTEDPKFLEHKRRVEAERREAAISRRKQAALRAVTPGTATPASAMPKRLDVTGPLYLAVSGRAEVEVVKADGVVVSNKS